MNIKDDFKITNDIINNGRIVKLLNKIRDYDIGLYSHSVRSAMLMEEVLPYFKLDDNISVQRILEGALLHDIGKLSVDIKVLNKKSALTELEYSLIKRHPLFGLNYLKNEPEEIQNCCLYHHENIDGSGYPNGIKGNEIPEYCKIMSVIDKVEALTSADRVYRFPLHNFFTLEKIICEEADKNHICKEYVDTVIKALRENKEKYLNFPLHAPESYLGESIFANNSDIIFEF